MAKKSKHKKTLVEQILDQHQVAYESLSWSAVDLTDEQQAEQLTDPIASRHQIYKTLAAEGDKTGPVIGLVPIDQHLSMKKLAAASGNKKASMLPQKILQQTTGYVHGANNPVGIWHNKKFPIYIDQQAAEEPFIFVSAGELGRSDKINANELAQLIGAKFVDLIGD